MECLKSLRELTFAACVQSPYEALAHRNPLQGNDFHPNDDEDECMQIDDDAKALKLRRDTFLPPNLAEPLLQEIVSCHDDNYLELFASPQSCRLTKLDLSHDATVHPVTRHALVQALFEHPLEAVRFVRCELAVNTARSFERCARTLRNIDLSYASGVKEHFTTRNLFNLTRLNLQGSDIVFRTHIENLPHLQWLNLSFTSFDLQALEKLTTLKSLVWLSLHNCTGLNDDVRLAQVLTSIPTLAHVDLSKDTAVDSTPHLACPSVTTHLLSKLAQLPALASLDISGSPNLCYDDLQPFQKRKLKFLGLLGTGLSGHSNLPAEAVAGESSEEQILTSLERQYDRQKYVVLVLRKLFALASRHACVQVKRCVLNMIGVMNIYKGESAVHCAATSSLYHLTREEYQENYDHETQKGIVVSLLESMENLPDVLQLQKNCCLTLCVFKLTEMENEQVRISSTLLATLQNHRDDYLLRIVILIFNHFVCVNGGTQKKEIGLHGAVNIVMNIIRDKIHFPESTLVIETCWSSLWNITDQTAQNCQEFLELGGLELFFNCLYAFPDSAQLLTNMMGLMGNIAEVDSLRTYLFEEHCIQLFISLLAPEKGLEVNYNAAGVLANLLMDGQSAWTVTSITRTACMAKMEEAIDRWNVNVQRNINYRSFVPILKILNCYHAPAAQYWAIWGLANLTKVYPNKYCQLIEEAEGYKVIYALLQADVCERVRTLANMVITSSKYDTIYQQ